MIHLHVHSEGSVLDGQGSIKRIVARAKELNMPAIALTDHGNMIKSFEFQKECESQNIKPIFGCEFYMGEPDTHNTYHLICLAKNNTGLKNLYNLNAFAYTQNFYKKPRITFEQLMMHREGLIVATACIGSEFGQDYINANIEQVRDTILRYKELFEQDFYLEIQPNTIPIQRNYNEFLVRVSIDYNVPLIVTTDAHYVCKEDAKAHDVMLAIQVGKKVSDPDRFRFNGNDYYIKTGEEIFHDLSYINPRVLTSAIANTYSIADKCNARIETGLNLLPSVGIEDEFRALCEHCSIGHMDRVRKGDCTGSKEEVDRIKYELSIIKQKGYVGYFLIVEDFIKWAKDKEIYVGPGRGSCAGSMVAYVLGIHNVNPIKYHLLFERFSNPERTSPPDRFCPCT